MNTNAWQTNTPANNAYGGFNLDFLQSGYGYQDLVNNPTGNPNGVGNLNLPASGGTGGGANTGGMFSDMTGPEWGNLALGGIQTLGGLYMGKKQLDMAKDQLDFQKRAFEKNYAAQRQRTNTQLRDRQKRRAYERPDYYQSVGEYMKENGVK